MATKHIHNPGPNVMFVGGKMIQPGDGRDIDEIYLPPELRDPPAEEVKPEPSLDELLAEELKKSVAKLVLLLPEWKLEVLDRLVELEGSAAAPRKSLLTAIDAERLRRASAQIDGQTGAPAGADGVSGAGSQGDQGAAGGGAGGEGAQGGTGSEGGTPV